MASRRLFLIAAGDGAPELTPVRETALGRVVAAIERADAAPLRDPSAADIQKVDAVAQLSTVASSFEGPHNVCLILPSLPNEAITLLDAIANQLDQEPLWRPGAIALIAETGLPEIQAYVTAEKRLADIVARREVQLIFLAGDASIGAVADIPEEVLSECRDALVAADTPEPITEHDLAELVTRRTDLLLDHFLYAVEGVETHVPLTARASNLAEDDAVVTALDAAIHHNVRGDFLFVPVGVPGAGVDVLCMSLADDPARVVAPSDVGHGQRAVVVCDLADDDAPATTVVRALTARGVEVAGVVALFGTARWNGGDVPWSWAIVRLPQHLAVWPSQESCAYCSAGVELLVSARGYDGFKRELVVPHPRVFWDAVRWSPSFVTVTHWASDQTPNHFQFRLLAAEYLDVWGEMTAARMRNLLAESIMGSWVDCVVSTDGATLGLAPRLAAAFGLPASRAWIVKRDELRQNPRGEGARFWRHRQPEDDAPPDQNGLVEVPAAEIEHARRPNVVIVDQAVHHFATFEALQRAVASVGGRALGLTVLADRFSLTEGEALPLSKTRYMPVYRWPVVAWTRSTCGCSGTRAA